MPHRAISPAASETELDISNVLSADIKEVDYSPKASGHGSVNRDESLSDDEDFIALQQAASNRKASNLKGRTVKKGGGFQAMGLNATVLKAIARQGFSVPTPIQRKTIPLIIEGNDVVAMARTGSGKSASFIVPLIEKLRTHSARVGARAVILSPSRELALQTFKVVKDLGRGTDLRAILMVGGDSLEDQFSSMATNPDIIVATPGRFLHLKVEMSLDLSSVGYIVFDEADRLFEMGFAAQLSEILYALPPSRQTLLFSATLPKSLVEFARAGLQEPKLIRLDTDSKVSPDLRSGFFTVKSAEKEGALLHLLQDVITMPTGETEAGVQSTQRLQAQGTHKKRKRGSQGPSFTESPTAHSTIIFVATKHHVEYVAALLRRSGYAVSHVYGSLDQTARKIQVQTFRTGMTNIMVVTDVAARGIDIPVLANVINYDFPPQPKMFIHRVGRTARAGKQGWSYSLVLDSDLPYLLDLQLFLSKRLIVGRSDATTVNYAEDIVVGSLMRDKVERSSEWVTNVLNDDDDLASAKQTAVKAEKLYTRTRNSASQESAQRAKVITASNDIKELNMLFHDGVDPVEVERERMIARVGDFRPPETVFEIGKRGNDAEAEIMRSRRAKVDARSRQASSQVKSAGTTVVHEAQGVAAANLNDEEGATDPDMAPASEDELEITFSQPSRKDRASENAWRDVENFMSYTSRVGNAVEDKGYGVHSGSYNTKGNANFLEAARGATMDLKNDESRAFGEPSKAGRMRWDKKSKKYVSRVNDADGSRGAKMVRGESGSKIAASYRSGRFEAWKKSNTIRRLPKVGEAEAPLSAGRATPGKRFKHKSEVAPKEADKYRDDFHKRKKRVELAKEKRVGRFKDGAGKNELRGVDDVRRQRQLKERRSQKNVRPSKKRRL